jgi:hypothetical protein
MNTNDVWLQIVCASLRGGRDAMTSKENADSLASAYDKRFNLPKDVPSFNKIEIKEEDQSSLLSILRLQ